MNTGHVHHYDHLSHERCVVCGKAMLDAIDEARNRLAQRELIERQAARRHDRETAKKDEAP